MASHFTRRNLVRIAAVYFPLIVGLAFTGVGVSDFLELSRALPAASIPRYGVLPFSSTVFSCDRVDFIVESLSLEGGYANCIFSETINIQGEGDLMLGLQVPGRVENAFIKLVGYDVEKNEVIFADDASVEWLTDSGVSLITYDVKPGKYLQLNYLVHFRWHGVVERISYTGYELLVPFSSGRSDVLETALPAAIMFDETPYVTLSAELPLDSRVVDSVPSPTGETIYWREDAVGHKSLVMEDTVPFGQPTGHVVLTSFRVSFETPALKQRYDRLVFDSGLFLGVGVQFLIAGLYDAIKLREK